MSESELEIAQFMIGQQGLLRDDSISISSSSTDVFEITEKIEATNSASARLSKRQKCKRNTGEQCESDEKVMKKQYYQKVPFQRILKRDIRRTYPQMYLNVINSGDIELALAYFQRFYDQNCQMLRLVQANDQGSLTVSDVTQITGLYMIFLHFASLMESIPDLICQWKDAYIRQHANSQCSEVVLELTWKGTKFFQLDINEMKAAVEEFQQRTGSAFPKQQLAMQILQNSAMYMKTMDPTRFTSVGRITLFLDERNCIQNMEIRRLLMTAEPVGRTQRS